MNKHFPKFGIAGKGKLRPQFKASNIRAWRERIRIADENAARQLQLAGEGSNFDVTISDRPWFERAFDWCVKFVKGVFNGRK